MVVLDEIVTCVNTKLLEADQVLGLVADYRKIQSSAELVLTGRQASPELIEKADLVTDMTLIKHYWYTDQVEARKGIDF